MSGRQIVFMIKENFAIDPAAGVIYTWEDIVNISTPGGDEKDKQGSLRNLREFAHKWDKTVSHLPEKPSDSHLVHYFVKELRKHFLMRHDVERYDEEDDGHEHRTYRFLHKQMWKRINRYRQNVNRKAQTETLLASAPGEHGKPGAVGMAPKGAA